MRFFPSLHLSSFSHIVGTWTGSKIPGNIRRAAAGAAAVAEPGRGRRQVSPWTVDCSLHPWLEGRRPLLGSTLVISTDELSLVWQHKINGTRCDSNHDEQEHRHQHGEPSSSPPAAWRSSGDPGYFPSTAVRAGPNISPARAAAQSCGEEKEVEEEPRGKEQSSERFAEWPGESRCRWTGVSLEGMWDVMESTLQGSGSLQTLLEDSGARVIKDKDKDENEDEDGRRVGKRGNEFPRAKL